MLITCAILRAIFSELNYVRKPENKDGKLMTKMIIQDYSNKKTVPRCITQHRIQNLLADYRGVWCQLIMTVHQSEAGLYDWESHLGLDNIMDSSTHVPIPLRLWIRAAAYTCVKLAIIGDEDSMDQEKVRKIVDIFGDLNVTEDFQKILKDHKDIILRAGACAFLENEYLHKTLAYYTADELARIDTHSSSKSTKENLERNIYLWKRLQECEDEVALKRHVKCQMWALKWVEIDRLKDDDTFNTSRDMQNQFRIIMGFLLVSSIFLFSLTQDGDSHIVAHWCAYGTVCCTLIGIAGSLVCSLFYVWRRNENYFSFHGGKIGQTALHCFMLMCVLSMLFTVTILSEDYNSNTNHPTAAPTV